MNQPLEPMKSFPVPNASENPTAQNIRNAIDTLMRIFPITAPAFFMRDSPTSSIANPACMKRTRTAAMNTKVVLMRDVGVGGGVLRHGECRDEQQQDHHQRRHQPE